MRVKRFGESIHIGLKYIFALGLFDGFFITPVAFEQSLDNFIIFFFGQLHGQSFIFEAFAPYLIQLGRCFCPGRLRAIGLVDFILLKIEWLLNTFFYISKAFFEALLKGVVNLISHRKIPFTHIVVQLITVALKQINVRLQKIAAVVIQRFNIAVEHL